MSTMETKTFPESRHKGHVKFFNSIKGYGFILPDTPQDGDGTEEVFVHHTAIQNSGGFKSLAEGEEVEYDLVQGPKGMQASNVTGPDGSSVRGDPGTHRQQYTSSNNINNNNNGYHNNRGGPYNGGYMVDPYSSSFGYGIPAGYPFMGQPMYGGGPYGGQPTIPPPFQQYGYVPPTPNSTSTPMMDPGLSPRHGYAMPIYPNYPPPYENLSPRQQKSSLTPPIGKDESSFIT